MLARTGLLPFGKIGTMDVTLAQNDSGRFECRWVNVSVEKSRCLFLNKNVCNISQMAVNHGEGRFFASKNIINKLEEKNLVLFKYVDKKSKPTGVYPQNPNGSTKAIAGICDTTGRILGLMPHPEKFVDVTQHPNWRRQEFGIAQGVFIFEEMIRFAEGS